MRPHRTRNLEVPDSGWRPLRNDTATKNPPSASTAGVFGRATEVGATAGRGTLRICWMGDARCRRLSDDFSRDLAETGNTERMGGAGREVEHPATNERAAVVDGDDDRTAAMAHAELGAEG